MSLTLFVSRAFTTINNKINFWNYIAKSGSSFFLPRYQRICFTWVPTSSPSLFSEPWRRLCVDARRVLGVLGCQESIKARWNAWTASSVITASRVIVSLALWQYSITTARSTAFVGTTGRSCKYVLVSRRSSKRTRTAMATCSVGSISPLPISIYTDIYD